MQRVTQVGYIGLEVANLPQWESFARDVLGLMPLRNEDGSLALRMDDYAQRFVLLPGAADDLSFVGWELPDEPALQEFVEQLAASGVKVHEEPSTVAAKRRVQKVFRAEDPIGIPVEFYCGPTIAREPFESTAVRSGFVTGDQGLGHMVIRANDLAQSADFYCKVLGLRVSDRIRVPMGAFELDLIFLHANPRHHSIALVAAPFPKRINHFMIEVNSLDDVGLAYDRCQDAGIPITRTLGRHPNDRMFSFYAQTPSGFDVEFGWGGRQVDDSTWRTRIYNQTSEWGHRPPGNRA